MVATRQRFTYPEVLAKTAKANPLHPRDFFSKWIPLIYGIQSGERNFKSAALDLLFNKGVSGIKWTESVYSTAASTWRWELGTKENYPGALKPLLGAFDILLQIMQVGKNLPKYSIENKELQE